MVLAQGVGKVFGMFSIIVVIQKRELVVLQMVIIIILQLAKIGVYNNHCLLQVWSFFVFWWEAIIGGLPSPSSFEAPSFCTMISSCKFPTTKDFAPNYCQASLGIYGILHCAPSYRVQLEILIGLCKKMQFFITGGVMFCEQPLSINWIYHCKGIWSMLI